MLFMQLKFCFYVDNYTGNYLIRNRSGWRLIYYALWRDDKIICWWWIRADCFSKLGFFDRHVTEKKRNQLRNPFITNMTTAYEVYTRRGVAQERKRIHESSEFIYPVREKNKGKHIPRKQNIGSFGTTSYSIDFAKKEGKPAMPRPCSVTRRNRPHPSQVYTF